VQWFAPLHWVGSLTFFLVALGCCCYASAAARLGLHWWRAAVAGGTALPSDCMCIKKTQRGAMHGVRQARVKCVIDSKGLVATVSKGFVATRSRHDCAHSCVTWLHACVTLMARCSLSRSCLTWLYADCGPSAGLGRQWSGCHLWQNSSQRLSAQVSLPCPAPLMLFCYPRLLPSYVMLLCLSRTHMHVSHTYLVV